jgi:hypothetical protein
MLVNGKMAKRVALESCGTPTEINSGILTSDYVQIIRLIF